MKIDGLIPGQAMGLSGGSDILSRLNPGDVIRAQLLEIMSNEVILKLFDGTTLKAAAMTDIDAGKGEFANFVVKNKVDNQIFLEQQKTNIQKSEIPDNMLLKQLASIGVEANEQTLKIAEKMNSNFIPFNKNIFDNILGMMDKFKDLGVNKAVFMASNNIAASEKNVQTLNQLVDARVQIGTEIDRIMKLLDSREINSASGTTSRSADIDVGIDNEFINNKNSELLKAVNIPGLKEKIKEFIGNSLIPADSALDNQLDNEIKEFIKGMPPELKPAEKNAVTDFIKSVIIKLRQSNEVEADNQTLPDMKKIEEFKKDINNIFVKLDDGNNEKDIDIKEIYKELYKKLEAVKEGIPVNSFTVKNELIQKIDNLQNHLRFINDINNHSAYVQIPVNISNTNSTGELYILKRDSKKKKINPEDTTMLIALNTQNIGRVESLITVNKKNISLNMRVEAQNIIDIFKENYKELYDRINEKGYRLADVKYRIVDNPVDVLNVNEVTRKDLSRGNVKVDIRI